MGGTVKVLYGSLGLWTSPSTVPFGGSMWGQSRPMFFSNFRVFVAVPYLSVTTYVNYLSACTEPGSWW